MACGQIIQPSVKHHGSMDLAASKLGNLGRRLVSRWRARYNKCVEPWFDSMAVKLP